MLKIRYTARTGCGSAILSSVMSLRVVPAAILAVLALVATLVDAGCYGPNKHLKKPIKDELRYWNHVEAPQLSDKDLPKAFDWTSKDGKNWLVPNWNQHIPQYCGSCYLHATLTMISDRLKIAKGAMGGEFVCMAAQSHSRHGAKAPDVMLGRQSFLNCGPPLGFSDGCDGGDVIDVVRYMAEYGLPDEGCMPYKAADYRDWGLKKGKSHCPTIAHCTNCMPGKHGKDDCWSIKHPVMYKLSAYGNVGDTKPSPDNVLAMMNEIYHRGPIVCSIACPEDFTWQYDGGIYNDTTGDTDVDHDIEVVGWGEENGVKFWHVRNSWGQYWGVNGFFRVMRGVNAIQIEAGDCWYANPTYEVEQAVDDGVLEGSMWGLRPKRNSSLAAQRAASRGEHLVQNIVEFVAEDAQAERKHRKVVM